MIVWAGAALVLYSGWMLSKRWYEEHRPVMRHLNALSQEDLLKKLNGLFEECLPNHRLQVISIDSWYTFHKEENK
jgi:hypothetical protein